MVPVVHDAEYLLKETNRASLLAAGEYVYPYDLARAIANALMNLNPHDTTLNERQRHGQATTAHCKAIVQKIKSGEFEAFNSDGVATTADGLETVIRHSDAVKYAANIGVIFKDMAAIDTAPEQTHPAPTVEAVTPAPVALVEPATPAPDDVWKTKARERAAELIGEARARDRYPSQVNLGDAIAKEFRSAGIMGVDGKPITGAYIKRHALSGISSAQGKQLSTSTKQGKQGK